MTAQRGFELLEGELGLPAMAPRVGEVRVERQGGLCTGQRRLMPAQRVEGLRPVAVRHRHLGRQGRRTLETLQRLGRPAQLVQGEATVVVRRGMIRPDLQNLVETGQRLGRLPAPQMDSAAERRAPDVRGVEPAQLCNGGLRRCDFATAKQALSGHEQPVELGFHPSD